MIKRLTCPYLKTLNVKNKTKHLLLFSFYQPEKGITLRRMEYQYLDIQIPVEEPEHGLLKVTKMIRPSWKDDDLEIKVGLH